LPLEAGARRARAEQRLDRFRHRLTGGRDALRSPPATVRGGLPVACTFDPDGYRRGVERVREHIRAGDLFQANLSQRWSCPVEPAAPGERALALADALAVCSPAPYAAFLAAEDHAIACASPERFLELRERRVETRPIKGTRPRAQDPAEDRRLAAELLASGKDRAENVMIVDVLRNDLGRVCETGSIRVTGLCELESFPQVHHLTSTVTGSLRPGLDAFDLLHACFPGGSITGAPKIRAMEILDALEPVRRHVYTGSLGYVDWRGDADWNIAIRTATVTPSAVLFAAGGGITAESDPELEYRETLDKAEGIRRAVEQVIGPLALDPTVAEVG
jgi:para-aminobenzoate synthetase component 1